MIPQITEINFPAYATLHQAVVNLSEMGERTITTQVRIDGDVTPSFSGMELSFKGERFVLPSDTPQAAKDNTTRNSLVDLVFESAPVQDLKRYFFFEPTSVNSSTAIADKYKASVNLNIEDFVVLLNKVLKYYFGTSIVASLYMSGQGYYSSDWKAFEIDYSKIWDVITKFYDVYGVRWRFSTSGGVTTIQIGYPDDVIDSEDHIFEYGYSGGLLKFERQVQDQDLVNILLGRGGEKNLPYRYFKKVDPLNDSWAADPDAIPELANIYFDRLRDINFRNYIQGWKTNPNRDTTTWPGTVVETYDSSRGATDWAYKKGHEDIVFNPVEYVKDDDSIAAYGEHWGALEDNDDIYPTIQGRTRHGLGRIDEVVSVSPITTDDITGTAGAASVEQNINSMRINVENDSRRTFELISEEFTVPTGMRGNVTYIPLSKPTANESLVYYDTANTTVTAIPATGNDVPISGLTPGTYKLRLSLTIYADQSVSTISGTFGIEGIVLHVAPPDSESWKPTFDIWVKNIWNTTKGQNESAVEYSQRVWGPILGDRAGNEAKVVFSTGFMSVSEDYEFTIADYPIFDQSHQVQTKDDDGTTTITVPSEWKITLRKSDAEYDTTGLFIPNSTTGGSPVAKDKFFFIGIDMPHDYVVWAEEELNTYKNTNLGEHSDVNPTWVISLDKVRINTLEDADNGNLLADLLSSGTKITIKDSRFAPTQMELYVRQITYTWNEPTDENPYLFPDVEVVLSENVMSSVSSYAKLQGEVSTIKSEYVRVSDVESVVRQVASPMFLKKTGEDDSSASPTTFASKVSSSGFRQGGVGGTGWGLYADNSRQLDEEDPDIPEDSVFEVDKLVVRKRMEVNSLVINQISYMGGKEIISAAKIEVTNVVDNGTTYTCYFDQRQGTVKNLFVAGDIAYGQVYNPGNTSIRYYKYVVDSVDVDRIVLLKSSADTGSVAPQVGDVIVQYGNTDSTNHADRQYVIIRDIIGGGYERMLSGLNSVSAAGTEYYFAGRQNGSEPRWFVGDRASNQYLEYANGKLTISGVLDVADTEESTTIQGNLIQTGTIQLGDVDEYDHFQVYSGISGDFDNNALGNGIAAWYGGPKVDHDASPSAQSYARSIFRFDGSGYLAGGMLKWGVENGEAFLNLNGENVTVGLGDVNLNDIANLLFDVVSIGNNRYAVKLRTHAYDSNGHTVQIDGLFTDGFLSGGGLNSTGGGGGGSQFLWSLNDVYHSSAVLRLNGDTVEPGDILSYATISGSGKWYARRVDSTPTNGSDNLISSGAVYASLLAKMNASDAYTKTEVDSLLSGYLEADDDRLLFVDPEAGVDVTVEDTTGTTGTVLWGAESANQVYLDVNGMSKALLKPQAIAGISSSIGTILGYFTAGSANNALRLGGHEVNYFATASYVSDFLTSSRHANYVWASPDGADGAPAFRALVANDIPSITTGKISDLETWIGNKGFITKVVNDLTNYYLKSETYTQAEVNALVGAINQFHYEIAASTSSITNPQSNVLYLIGPTGSGSDKYEEYVYPNMQAGFVKIGDTSIDLSSYVNSVVASGSGNYISGFTKVGNVLTLAMATLPTSLKNPYKLTFGSKEYDGSAAVTLAASDIGAITSHQTLYDLVLKNYAGTAQLTYKPAENATYELSLTKALVGLSNVENTALSSWAGSGNITTLGTIATGVWNGTNIAADKLAIDFNWTLIGNSATYDTSDLIVVN